jgi:hypothetical protein
MKNLIVYIALLLSLQPLMAQEVAPIAPSAPKYAARLDLYHQYWVGDFSFGSLAVLDPVYIRPGFRVGIERSWVTKNHFRLYQDVMAGYYHNTYEERSWTLGTDLGFEWRIFKQFRLALPIGVHYNNAKAIDVRYEYVGDKWVKAKNTDPTINRLQVPLGLNLGWRFMAQSAHPIDAFVNGNLSIIGPWQPGSGIAMLLTKSVGVGLRVGL